jgi:hypothetical protein
MGHRPIHRRDQIVCQSFRFSLVRLPCSPLPYTSQRRLTHCARDKAPTDIPCHVTPASVSPIYDQADPHSRNEGHYTHTCRRCKRQNKKLILISKII